MFNKIYNNSELFPIIVNYCEENNIEVSLSKNLEKNSDNKLLILEIDSYYHSKNMKNPPPAIDCLILLKCDQCEGYDIYLVELKNIKSPKGFNVQNIIAKFQTVIDDFLQNRFKDIFYNENYCNFKCCFISNPYGLKNISQEDYEKKIHAEELKLDYFNFIKPFKFKNKISWIKSILPNPTISEC